MPGNAVNIFSRATKRVEQERVLGGALVRLVQIPVLGTLFRWLLFDLSAASRVIGWWADSTWSRHFIPRFIRKYRIDPDDLPAPVQSYRTFNEFFTRSPSRDPRALAADNPDAVFSPADGCALVVPEIPLEDLLHVKNSALSLVELVGDRAVGFLGNPDGVDVFIVRLAPRDYHRFHFPGAGRCVDQWTIPGGYRPVHPLALAAFSRVHTVNHRQVSCLDGGALRWIQVEVGAFGVGTVVQTHHGGEFQALDEKGLFRVGGSTVVLVFPRGLIVPERDLVENSRDGIETRLRVGDVIGRKR